MATLVEGDLKASFSIATTLRCREVCYSIPRIASLYPWSSPYNAKCQARRHQVPFFESLMWLDLRLNPGLLDHWWTHYPLGRCPGYIYVIMIKNFIYIYIYIYIYIHTHTHTQQDCMEKGWICHVILIEVGCHGFLGQSVISFLSKTGITGRYLKVASNRFQTTAQYASNWIWSKARNFQCEWNAHWKFLAYIIT